MTHPSTVHERIAAARSEGRALLYVLVDPDELPAGQIPAFAAEAEAAGVDGFLVGGSLTMHLHFADCVRALKGAARVPVVIFPGGVHQISGDADAILFLSIISGRNPEFLIGQHVVAAPIVRALGLEAIPTGYMLVESGAMSTAQFMSGSDTIPRAKPAIAAAHAMAAEMLGMRLVYLEAGSGAPATVPDEMVRAVAQGVSVPVVVGGGIRTPAEAASKVRAGATVVVIGNHFEEAGHRAQIAAFAAAVHTGAS